jgi:hypothetical protein
MFVATAVGVLAALAALGIPAGPRPKTALARPVRAAHGNA